VLTSNIHSCVSNTMESKFNSMSLYEVTGITDDNESKLLAELVNLATPSSSKQRVILMQNYANRKLNKIRVHNEKEHEFLDSAVSNQLKRVYNNSCSIGDAIIPLTPSPINHDAHVRQAIRRRSGPTASSYLYFAEKTSQQSLITESILITKHISPSGLVDAIREDEIILPNTLENYSISPSKKGYFRISSSPVREDSKYCSKFSLKRKMLRRNAYV